jgi:hypothetical protein
MSGKDLFANDTYTVDIDSPTAAGCHPTDVGHYRIARHYSTILPEWMDGITNDDNVRAVQAAHDAYLAGQHDAAANRQTKGYTRPLTDYPQKEYMEPLNCEPLPSACPGQEGKNASCFACAAAHASALSKDPVRQSLDIGPSVCFEHLRLTVQCARWLQMEDRAALHSSSKTGA